MIEGRQLVRGDVYLAGIIYPGDKRQETHLKFVVVIQDCSLLTSSPTVAILILTTKRLEKIYPWEVFLTPEECKGESGAKIISNQPYTIPKSHLINYKYSLPSEKVNQVNLAIAKVMGL